VIFIGRFWYWALVVENTDLVLILCANMMCYVIEKVIYTFIYYYVIDNRRYILEK